MHIISITRIHVLADKWFKVNIIKGQDISTLSGHVVSTVQVVHVGGCHHQINHIAFVNMVNSLFGATLIIVS